MYSGYVPSVSHRWRQDNAGNRLILAERAALERELLLEVAGGSLSKLQVLEVGCGSGNELARLVKWGARPDHLHGIDLMEERVDAARREYPGIDFRCADASNLPFPDKSMDLVMIITVFSSIQSTAMRGRISREVRRVLKPGGNVLWYDVRYPNPKNTHLRPVSTADLTDLFPTFRAKLRTTTVLPPLMRALGGMANLAYPFLARIPAVRSHLIGTLTKPVALDGGEGFSIRMLERDDLEQAARLHVDAFASFFLARAGVGFMREYYSAFLSTPGAFALVATRGDQIVGSVLGVRSRAAFYRHLYRTRFAALARALGPRFLLDAEFRNEIWERERQFLLAARSVLRLPEGNPPASSETPARLLAICVDDRARGVGIAEALVAELCQEMKVSGIDRVGLSVHRGNARAIAFYKRSGWVEEDSTAAAMQFSRST
jgi:ubiquinone/menaquinone biosynthesis C-methylase UbiE/ribosomal protein S18 acetylase RimI-like enzyme